MNTKVFYTAIVLAAGLSIAAVAPSRATSQAQGGQSALPPGAPVQMNKPPAQSNSSQPLQDCSQLPADQIVFFGQFTDMNLKQAFCSQLTSDQRRQVMAMTYQPDSTGVLLTADQAMQKYMQANNIKLPGSTPPGGVPRRSGGSCPVKQTPS